MLDELGGQREGTRWLAMHAAGLDPAGPLPPARTPAHTRYRSERRKIERYRKAETGEAGQKRRAPTSYIEDNRTAVQAEATRRRIDRMGGRGVRARVGAEVRVSEDRRFRVMPAPPGPGLYLPASSIGPALDALRAGRSEEAEALFVNVFMAKYMTNTDSADPDELELGGAEVGEIKWIRVWPDGEAEPE